MTPGYIEACRITGVHRVHVGRPAGTGRPGGPRATCRRQRADGASLHETAFMRRAHRAGRPLCAGSQGEAGRCTELKTIATSESVQQ